MDIFFTNLAEFFVDFYHSTSFAVIKFILIIYLAVVFVDLVLVIILREMGVMVREIIKGMNMPAVPPNIMRRRWMKIKNRLESDNPSQYKAAILEADALADKVLASIGYKGANMTERLAAVKPGQLDNLEDLRNAHQFRNRIIHEAGFTIDKNKVEELLTVYESLLSNLELL